MTYLNELSNNLKKDKNNSKLGQLDQSYTELSTAIEKDSSLKNNKLKKHLIALYILGFLFLCFILTFVFYVNYQHKMHEKHMQLISLQHHQIQTLANQIKKDADKRNEYLINSIFNEISESIESKKNHKLPVSLEEKLVQVSQTISHQEPENYNLLNEISEENIDLYTPLPFFKQEVNQMDSLHSKLRKVDFSETRHNYEKGALLKTLHQLNLNAGNVDLWQNINFNFADLKHSQLEEAQLQYSDLVFSTMDQSNLENANLCHSKITNGSFKVANLKNSLFSYANLNNSNLYKAQLEGCIFNFASLENAQMMKCNGNKASFKQAKLMRANFIHANFNNAIFSGANLKDATLIKADLSETDFSHSKAINSNFLGSQLNKANLSNAKLSHANFSEAYLAYSKCKNSNLEYANFEKCYAIESNFYGSNFKRANLSKSNFSFANLRKSDLRLANLKHMNLTNALLDSALVDHHDWINHANDSLNIIGASELKYIYTLEEVDDNTYMVVRK
ncbi:pentapeptide repeat-containing protein [Aureibacter tunicatorum]|uniref:Uncharacterized protein YjbI with pentapeptide repeats n=1 Tax=Aureibacter tunicatorum TaxID=866807 RepID=A0AAE3XT89_9BACT|nr:pentapeptide repeat-containing protein [Aureibacter tunicatorum]MDR6241590.1 uncharacterized protein YjbI with pentapeptide repeats [Aureibacter tunicatorum]BDD07186.1 hypothetical protein AUTU_46690 [Aureibacter tunicatorum]